MDQSEEVGSAGLKLDNLLRLGAAERVWRWWPEPGPARPDLTWLCVAASGDERQRSPKMLSLDGLEMIAVLVVMGLFIKVLEQFGMFEPVGGEGNGFDSELCWFNDCGKKKKSFRRFLENFIRF